MNSITYTGKGFSLNDAYNTHWRTAKKKKDELKGFFATLLDANPITYTIPRFTLLLRFNARYDVDNTVPMIKLFVDQLRYKNFISDDTKNIFESFAVEYDSTLPKQTYQFNIFSPTITQQKRIMKITVLLEDDN